MNQYLKLWDVTAISVGSTIVLQLWLAVPEVIHTVLSEKVIISALIQKEK